MIVFSWSRNNLTSSFLLLCFTVLVFKPYSLFHHRFLVELSVSINSMIILMELGSHYPNRTLFHALGITP